MPRTRRKKHQREDIYITNSNFKIAKNRSGGVAIFEYERDRGGWGQPNDTIQVSLPIISCWVDKRKNNAAKVYMEAGQGLTHKGFMNAVISNGTVETRDGHLTAERVGQGGIIRFGAAPDKEYEALDENYKRYHIYDTKALAIEAIINRINHIVQVGGVDLVDLTLIDDSVLIESGFEKVPDAMNKGPAMWMGDPDNIVQAGTNNRFSYTAQKENCISFLQLMRASLSNKG